MRALHLSAQVSKELHWSRRHQEGSELRRLSVPAAAAPTAQLQLVVETPMAEIADMDALIEPESEIVDEEAEPDGPQPEAQ
jgi:hypothetical protein